MTKPLSWDEWMRDEHSKDKYFPILRPLLDRIGQAAAAGGALPADIATLREIVFERAVEKYLRYRWEHYAQQIEPLAEIGRKVSDSRHDVDQTAQMKRDSEIAFCATRLLASGESPRGIAKKIKTALRSDLSERHINRILDDWMPILMRGDS